MEPLKARAILWMLLVAAFTPLASLSAPRRAVVTWDGGGATNNWSEALNWSTDALPTAADVATFNATNVKNCTVNVNPNVQGIDIQAGYTGTITQAAGVAVAAGTSGFLQAAGTFSGGSSAITVNGPLSISGGAFTSTTGELNVTGAGVTVTGGSLTLTTGRLFSAGTYTQSGGTFAGGNNLIDVNGAFSLSNGTFTSTSGTLDAGGGFSHSGGTFDAGGGRVSLSNAANQNLAVSATTQFNHLAVNESLFGYWKLDETASPSVDSSGSGSDGAWQNGAASSTDVAPLNFPNPGSLQFDGVDDYVRVPRSTVLEPGSTFTIMCWLKRNGNAAEATRWSAMFRKSWMNNTGPTFGSYALQLPQGDYSRVAFGTGHAGTVNDLMTAPGTLLNQTWTHVAAVYEPGAASNNKRIYINGSLVAQSNLTTPVIYDTAPSGDFFIGSPSPASGEFFAGWIDDLRLYNRVLTLAEIQTIAAGDRLSTFSATTTVTGAALDVNGTLTINSGRLDTGSQPIRVGGSWTNNDGAFVAGTQTVTFDGAGGSSILSNAQPFNNLTVNGSSAGGVWTLLDALTANGTLAVTQGTLVQTTFGLAANAVTVGASGTWANASTGDVTLGAGGVSNAGVIVLDGGGSGCGVPATNDILIRSSAPGVQRPWGGTGTFTIEDVDVMDQAGTATINVYSGTDSGNNGANWVFQAACPVTAGSSSDDDGRCSCGVRPAIPGVPFAGGAALLLVLLLRARRK